MTPDGIWPLGARVYLAAPWELQQDARAIAAALAAAGIECTAQWLDASDNTFTEAWATRCLEDIRRCDALIAWNPSEWARGGTGGRHVELGAALALGKPVIVIGARTNIFHELHQVSLVEMDAAPLVIANVLAIGSDPAFWAREGIQ